MIKLTVGNYVGSWETGVASRTRIKTAIRAAKKEIARHKREQRKAAKTS